MIANNRTYNKRNYKDIFNCLTTTTKNVSSNKKKKLMKRKLKVELGGFWGRGENVANVFTIFARA